MAAALLAVSALPVLGDQPDLAAQSGENGEIVHQPITEVRAQRFDKDLASFAPAVEQVAPAVVRISTALRLEAPVDLAGGVKDPLQRYLWGRASRAPTHSSKACGLGSGVIATEDGFILTNSHLVDGVNEVEVALQDGRQFRAKVIGLDRLTDIAVIKIDARHLPTIPLADSRNVRVGDLVLAIGNPFGVGQTVTHGIVSAIDRGDIGLEDYESFIQTDAPINPGNSGGALVDASGHLIGINTAILSKSGGSLGIGFAVPSDLARRVMDDLVRYGHVVRGYLGIEAQDLTPELAEEFKLHNAPGVLVGGVTPSSPAERAGLQVGDVITYFDGRKVRNTRELKLWVAETRPCQTVRFEVERDGSAKPLRVIMGEVPASDLSLTAERVAEEQTLGALQGVTMIELSTQVRQLLKIPRNVQGTVVLDLHAYSPAAQAGLRPGDVIQSVNRQEIRSAEEASRLIQSAKVRRTLLRVWSHSGSHFILVSY